MDQTTNRILFALLCSAICDRKASKEELQNYNKEQLPGLMRIAKMHDVVHLLAYGLQINQLAESNADLNKELFKAIYRQERMDYALDSLCNILEAEKIPFIPLKGAVIRRCYKQAWMRTSCDIDVLVKETDVDRAADLLSEKYKYINEGKSKHDISLISPNDTHIELHYKLLDEGDDLNSNSDVLLSVWERALLCENCQYRYELPDDMFYFYHIVHMAKHFNEGGCGIKPFIDLYILDNIDGADIERRNALLSNGGLLKFADSSRRLASAWFSGKDMDELCLQMEGYVLSGGVYGNMQNRVKIQQQRQGGKSKYIASRIFIPYDEIKFEYPILIKHKWLTPFAEMRRWFRLAFRGRAKNAIKELKFSMDISSEESGGVQEFLKRVGL